MEPTVDPRLTGRPALALFMVRAADAGADLDDDIDIEAAAHAYDVGTRRDQQRIARLHGEAVCPGPPDAHEHLTPDDACYWCGAAL